MGNCKCGLSRCDTGARLGGETIDGALGLLAGAWEAALMKLGNRKNQF
jgi:hypothetical protein